MTGKEKVISERWLARLGHNAAVVSASGELVCLAGEYEGGLEINGAIAQRIAKDHNASIDIPRRCSRHRIVQDDDGSWMVMGDSELPLWTVHSKREAELFVEMMDIISEQSYRSGRAAGEQGERQKAKSDVCNVR